MSRTPFARRLRRVAAIVLLCGAAASGGIWLAASDADESAEFAHGSIAETRATQQLERLGGKGAVMILRFQQGFESLWHGRRLALTVGVLSMVVAAFCFYLAALADEDDQ